MVHVARDREEEVAEVARRVKHARSSRSVGVPVGRRVGRAAAAAVRLRRARSAALGRRAVPDVRALPLAAEPYAAALDLVLSCVSADFARVPAIALLRSPHVPVERRRATSPRSTARWPKPATSAASNRSSDCSACGGRPSRCAAVSQRAMRAGEQLLNVARELAPLRSTCAGRRSPDVSADVSADARVARECRTSRFAHATSARAAPSSRRSARCATPTRGSTRRRSAVTTWRRSSAGGLKGRRSRRVPATRASIWWMRTARASALRRGAARRPRRERVAGSRAGETSSIHRPSCASSAGRRNPIA